MANKHPVSLRELRTAAGYSQYTLAEKTGLARLTIASTETFRKPPNTITLKKYLDALGYDIGIINRETGECMPLSLPEGGRK